MHVTTLTSTQANFLITFVILTRALEDPTVIGGKAIEVVNTILTYIYVGLLLFCFILALGNRPQGSKRGYTLAFVGFALMTAYMTVRACANSKAVLRSNAILKFAAIYLAVRSVQITVANNGQHLTAGDFISNAIFRDVVLSVAATIGLYVLSSLIHVGPPVR